MFIRVTFQGLSTEMVKINYHLNGPNCSTSLKLMPKWLRLFRNMFGWFNVVLWIAAFLCYVVYLVDYSTQQFTSLGHVRKSVLIQSYQYYDPQFPLWLTESKSLKFSLSLILMSLALLRYSIDPCCISIGPVLLLSRMSK